MAATYDPTLATAKDRVREMVDDVAAPFRFQDEEIVALLTRMTAAAATEEVAEIDVAIHLLQRDYRRIGSSSTIKQGSVSRTQSGLTSQGLSALIAALQAQRTSLLCVDLSGGIGFTVVQPDYPETRSDQGWAGFGLPTQ